VSAYPSDASLPSRASGESCPVAISSRRVHPRRLPVDKDSRTREFKKNQQSRAEVRIATFLCSCVLEFLSS
jgi:hypothetical protein